MPKDLLGDLRVHPGLREQRGTGVPQRVERKPAGERTQPQRAAVVRAPTLRIVGRALDVAAARLPTTMLRDLIPVHGIRPRPPSHGRQ